MKRLVFFIIFLFIAVYLAFIFRKKIFFKKNIKSLNILIPHKLESLDPKECDDEETLDILHCIYQRLFKIDIFDHNKLIPELAIKIPTIKNNELIIEIHKNIRFHNNLCFKNSKEKELKIEDVVYSILRIADPKNESIEFSKLLCKYIKGLDDWCKNQKKNISTNYDEKIDGLQIIDDYTLKINVNENPSEFLKLLTLSKFLIVSKNCCKYYNNDLKHNPIGTGPYLLKKFEKEILVLTKNKYFKKSFLNLYNTSNRSKINFDLINFYIETNFEHNLDIFKKKEIDILNVPDDLINTFFGIDHKLKDSAKDINYSIEDGVSTLCLGFNPRKKIFKDIRIRKAISLSINREEFNKFFFNGMYEIAQSVIPPKIEESKAEYMSPYSSFDQERSNQLLEDAGYHNLKKEFSKFNLNIIDDEYLYQQANYLKRSLEKLGFNIEIIRNNKKDFIKKIHSNDCDLYLFNLDFYLPYTPKLLNFKEYLINNLIFNKITNNKYKENIIKLNSNNDFGYNLPFIFLTYKKHIKIYKSKIKFLWKPFFKDYIIYLDKID